MTESAVLAEAYMRQAVADFLTWESLCARQAPHCHRLQFLQMTCEKLCKAYLIRGGTAPAGLQTSHAFVAGVLPVICQRSYSDAIGTKSKIAQHQLKAIRKLCREIELLAPAVDDGGARPDNCEYPWITSLGAIVTPIEHAFPCLDFLRESGGPTLLKFLRYLLTSA